MTYRIAMIALLLLADVAPTSAQEGVPPVAAWEAAIRSELGDSAVLQPQVQWIFESSAGLGSDMQEVIKYTAAAFGGEVGRRGEHITCNDKTLSEKHSMAPCRMPPHEVLIRLRPVSTDTDSAVVEIGISVPDAEGRVDTRGRRLLLKKEDGKWVVAEVLFSWAS